ncbi:maleylpyruvate isomerase family mycothiol-dependent enzyme [Streptomyces iconiensis]|uniref:Maleylpyruvate isomerase family mycothiol-dependent enzyme n=1 Tax=Streptomyces iconiensis TaxID=1384038 RepID=A0ABT6ZVE7_9ACTN|nr:maleylpyruvate isomerase family mycothiol-dependent enzyme [Streptomyces iconiensis]MDJ1133030.1 maleylpyruvate isomerase family mycothiol-dependent enzyme [Streptomyces iconiensis]
MDYLPHFEREATAFADAVRRTVGEQEAPPVPSCPGWRAGDLAVHLGGVHRFVRRILDRGLLEQPDLSDLSLYELPDDLTAWPHPDNAPNRTPVLPVLVDWFERGAAGLAERFRDTDPAQRVWSWSDDWTAGFWLRIQTVEVAVHRWDAEGIMGQASPFDTELAVEGVTQNLDTMVPARRARNEAPPGKGESYGFRQTDGPGAWTVRFDGDTVTHVRRAAPSDVRLSGTASDLMLFLWGRLPADRLEIDGERSLIDRYAALVPPV